MAGAEGKRVDPIAPARRRSWSSILVVLVVVVTSAPIIVWWRIDANLSQRWKLRKSKLE
jgi:hypothetical protein